MTEGRSEGPALHAAPWEGPPTFPTEADFLAPAGRQAAEQEPRPGTAWPGR